MPETFDFKPLPTTSGGADYSNQHMADPGANDERVWGSTSFRRIGAIGPDWVLPYSTMFMGEFMATLGLLFVVANSVIWQGISGRTLGKEAMGLRLAWVPNDMVREQTWAFVTPGIGRCAIRLVLHFFDLLGFVGVIVGIVSPYGRSFADRLAKTVVIWDDRLELIDHRRYMLRKRGKL